jgi:hypothetical protein
MNRQPMVSLQRTVRPLVSRGNQEARGALQHADLGIGVGVDHVEPVIVAVGDELLAAVHHLAAARFRGAASWLEGSQGWRTAD